MSFRRFIAVGAVAAAVSMAGAALAQTSAQKAMIDQAKAAGVVGEQADGYLGFRSGTSDSDLQEAVRVTNEARRRADAAALRSFEDFQRSSKGQSLG